VVDGVPVLADEVGEDQCNAAAGSDCAVDEDVAVVPNPLDEFKDIIEMELDLVTFLVLCSNEEVILDVPAGVVQFHLFGSCNNRSYIELCVRKGVPLMRGVLVADSRSEM
jgi:hypothetical protein